MSLEVNDFLQRQGIDLDELSAVTIKKLRFTSDTGVDLETQLPLGGKGISRYALDHALYQKATENCQVLKDKATSIQGQADKFIVSCGDQSFTSDVVLMATGKRSVLDKNLNREFIQKKSPWLGVKMHYDYEMPDDLVELHNFPGGYAGLSKVENGKVNCCYLSTFDSFKDYKDIEKFNREHLSKNSNLKHFFKNAIPAWEKPITISQISFEDKNPVENGVIMIGDTAGLIHPLCGNGQAMAIHSAALAARSVHNFLSGKIDREQMLDSYTRAWNSEFKTRMKYGRWLQNILLNNRLTITSHKLLKLFPAALPYIVRKTHGKPFH